MRTMAGVVVGVMVFATAASADAPGSTAFVKHATQSVEPRVTIVPAAPTTLATPTATELQDLAMLAESKGMTLEEAVAEYGWRAKFSQVANDLQYAHPSSFVEAASGLGDDYGARISFTGDAPPDAAARLAEAGLPVAVQIRDRMGWTEKSIVEAAQRIHFAVPDDLASGLGTDPGADIGEIRVTVAPVVGLSVDETRARIRAAATSDGPLRRALDQVPPTVSVVIEVIDQRGPMLTPQ